MSVFPFAIPRRQTVLFCVIPLCDGSDAVDVALEFAEALTHELLYVWWFEL